MSIVIGGDVCITPDTVNKMKTEGVSSLYDKAVFELFSAADLTVVNLECPLTESKRKIRKSGPNHKSCKESVSMLKELKVSLASLANNHILDFGEDGLNDTRDVLLNEHIGIIGVKELHHEKVYQIRKVDETVVGFISFADDEFNGMADYGDISIFDPLCSFDQIRELKDKCDAVIVLFHSGIEHYEYVSPYLQKVCHKMIDSGASMVLCQHSHCIGVEEYYKDGYVLYGQGNFHFFRESNRTVKWNSAIILKINVSAHKKLERELIFVEDQGGKIVRLDNDSEVRRSFEARTKRIGQPGFVEDNFRSYCRQYKKEFVLSYISGRSKWFYRLMKITKGVMLPVLLPLKRAVLISNLIRCCAHNEVVKTVLKEYIYDEKRG